MDHRITKVLNHIESNLSLVVKLDELASIACLSPSQFHRLFKVETGSTPFRFCQKIKLHFAYQLLTIEDTNISDLSIQLGYKDYETFSRAFKKQFHLAPGDLKAIVNKVNSKVNSKNKVLIATFDDSALTDANYIKLIELTKTNNLSADDLQQAQIYTVSKKDHLSVAINTIKNKFEMKKDLKIWQKLISEAK